MTPETNAPHASPKPSQYALLTQGRFAPFFWTQFFGAANDNIFKVAFSGLVTYHTALFSGVDAQSAAFLIAAIFIAPYVLFSATSGQISDKYDKARIMRLVKSLEIGIMLLGAAGFYGHSAPLLYAATFMMGLHSTLFGPVKYAYLPQHLQPQELVGGNGLIEMGTFVAILLGTIAGGALANIDDSVDATSHSGLLLIGGVCIGIAVLGRIVASFIPASPSDQRDLKINWNPFTETWRNLKIAKANRTVFLSMLGISWLWFFGSIFLTSFFNYAKEVLGGDAQVVTLLLAVFSVGIGIGSLLCERLSGEKVEIGLVPFGSIGMTVFAIDLYFASRGLHAGPVLIGVAEFLHTPHHWRVLADLFLLAMFGGFYSVPLYALIQSRCETTHRARIIAANNILNAVFMIVASLMAMLLFRFDFSIPQVFLITGLLNAAVAIYIYTLVPEFLMRFLAWLLIHSFYRVRGVGTERLPHTGGAMLVCNHVSFLDAVVVMAESPRPIRFVMDHRIFKVPVLSFIFRTARAIAIAPAKEDPQMLAKANALIDQALTDGDLVCIFPEGRITDTGELYPFKAGIARIIERNPVPVYPMALRGLWGSWFSRFNGSAFTSLPRPLRRGWSSRLELAVGEAVQPQDVTPEGLQERVQALRGKWK